MFSNWEIFTNNNIEISPLIKQQLNTYYEFLKSENKKYNLTRIIDEKEVYEKHFLDSLLFTKEYPLKGQKIADIGTGPGFPGVVIKIFFPRTKITLIESNSKKIKFLEMLIEKLDLKDIEISNERAEEFSLKQKEEYDIVISRAVAYLDILLEIGVQMIKVNGNFIALKGPRADEEINHSGNKPSNLGLKLENKQILEDVGFGIRVNLFYKKTEKTNPIYPRKYSQIKKESK